MTTLQLFNVFQSKAGCNRETSQAKAHQIWRDLKPRLSQFLTKEELREIEYTWSLCNEIYHGRKDVRITEFDEYCNRMKGKINE